MNYNMILTDNVSGWDKQEHAMSSRALHVCTSCDSSSRSGVEIAPTSSKPCKKLDDKNAPLHLSILSLSMHYFHLVRILARRMYTLLVAHS
jgi:hypothetical protein